MTIKEYLTAYKKKDGTFDVKEILQQLCVDFSSMVELNSNSKNWNLVKFLSIKKRLRSKFDSLKRRGVPLEDKHWDFVHTKQIATMRYDLFGKTKPKEEKRQHRSEADAFSSFSKYCLATMARSLLGRIWATGFL